MAATVRISYWTAAGTGVDAETGVKFNRDATQSGTTAPVPKPNAAGTAYSWTKPLALEVTSADSTSISNRKIHRSASPPAGITMWYRSDGNTYQAPALAAADNATTNDAAPGGFTTLPSSATVYDAVSAAASLGRNGAYVSVATGVSNLYVGGAGSNIVLPNIVFTYDEA